MPAYLFIANTPLVFDGAAIGPGTTVAVVETRHPIDNVLSAIRTDRITCERVTEPQKPAEQKGTRDV